MTTPYERTSAVVSTREFLETLATGADVAIPGLVPSVAIGVLRHYPLPVDIYTSVSELPAVWANR